VITMSNHIVNHADFTLERTYDAPPAKVFRAFADPEAKAQWFGSPEGWVKEEVSLDFRVGGREVSAGGPAGGPVHRYEATYQDIVPNERIITTYSMFMDGTLTSVSVSAMELVPDGEGTRLVLTEHGAYLDGNDSAAGREHGTGELLDALGTALKNM
jgi:uncharacterized protein YndB with AHSA1/START domain